MNPRFFFCRVSLRAMIIGLLLSGSAAARGDGPNSQTALPIHGEPFQARLVEIDPEGKIAFAAEGGQRQIAATELVRWGALVDGAAGPLVVLTRGGTLVAVSPKADLEPIKLDGDALVVKTLLWGTAAGRELYGSVRVPVSSVRAVIMAPPADPSRRERLIEKVLEEGGEGPKIFLENGDILAGQLTALDGQSARLSTPAGELPVPIEKIVALSLSAVPTVRVGRVPILVGFRDGTQLEVEQFARAGEAVEAVLSSGLHLPASPDVNLWSEVTLIQPLSGSVTYLSDLVPLGYKHVPYLTLPWAYGTDRNVLGTGLRAEGARWVKGLGMHSASRLAYRLDRPFRRLDAELAVDDEAGRRGSVTFRVFLADETGTWRQAYQSPVIRGGMEPVPMSVDLDGARQIALIVDFADRGDECDYADWLGVRLIR